MLYQFLETIMHKMADTFTEILNFGIHCSKHNGWTFIDAILKGSEEEGELSEAILSEFGRTKKKLKEHYLGEIADNINQVFDLVSHHMDNDTHFKTRHLNNFFSEMFFTETKFFDSLYENNSNSKTTDLYEVIVSKMVDFSSLKHNVIKYPESVSMDVLCDLISTVMVIGFLLHLNEYRINLSEFKQKHFNYFIKELHKQLKKKLSKWQKKYKLDEEL